MAAALWIKIGAEQGETRRARVEIEAQRAARATTPTTTTEAHHGG